MCEKRKKKKEKEKKIKEEGDGSKAPVEAFLTIAKPTKTHDKGGWGKKKKRKGGKVQRRDCLDRERSLLSCGVGGKGRGEKKRRKRKKKKKGKRRDGRAYRVHSVLPLV